MRQVEIIKTVRVFGGPSIIVRFALTAQAINIPPTRDHGLEMELKPFAACLNVARHYWSVRKSRIN